MKRFSFAIPMVALVSMFMANSTYGQDGFEVAYGDGVHHFFNGEYQKAYDSLTTAMGQNQRDPRIHYFRGLAAQNLGIGGTGDFQMGAQLEAANGGRSSLVNDSLERIQGHSRVSLERARNEAMLMANRARPPEPVVPVNRTFPVGGHQLIPGTPKSDPGSGSKMGDRMGDGMGEVEIHPIVPGQEIEHEDMGSDTKKGSGTKTPSPEMPEEDVFGGGFDEFPPADTGSGSKTEVPGSDTKTELPGSGSKTEVPGSDTKTELPGSGSKTMPVPGGIRPIVPTLKPSGSGSKSTVPNNPFAK